MHPDLEKIKAAAEGLLFISESDFPFEVVEINGSKTSLENNLKTLSGKEENTLITNQALDDFFRSSTTFYSTDTEVQKQNVQRFLHLKNVLNETLAQVQVFRLGSVQIDVFIIGELKDGTLAGLKTKLIET